MRKLLLLVIATIFGSMTIMATPDTLISKVYYDLVDSSLTAFVTHDGDFSDGAGYSGNVTIPATIKVGANVYTVVGVSDNAFYIVTK